MSFENSGNLCMDEGDAWKGRWVTVSEMSCGNKLF